MAEVGILVIASPARDFGACSLAQGTAASLSFPSEAYVQEERRLLATDFGFFSQGSGPNLGPTQKQSHHLGHLCPAMLKHAWAARL